MIIYPQIDPIAFSIGPLDFRWYGISYLMGFFSLMWLAKRLSKLRRFPLSNIEIDDMVMGFILGVVIGGRLGEILFYHPDFYLTHPLEIFKIWKGGMSFHGGLLGAAGSYFWFARRIQVPAFLIFDAMTPLIMPGLFFGRIANFINGELIGRPTDVPWAMIFPNSDGLPRHPSQLYEALLEGLLLFVLLYLIAFWRTTPTYAYAAKKIVIKNKASAKKQAKKIEKDVAKEIQPRYINGMRAIGVVSGTFLIGYGLLRFMVEFTRTPDTFMGIYPLGFSMGQFLSAVMVAIGIYVISTSKKRHQKFIAKFKN